MKKYPHSHTLLVILFAGLSSTMLSACDSEMMRSLTGNGRPDQMVPGGRHAPALNPRIQQAPSAPMPASAPPATAPRPANDLEMTPYDDFDDQGNVIEKDDTSQGNVFGNLFNNEPKRKPVPSNPIYAVPVTPPAPAQDVSPSQNSQELPSLTPLSESELSSDQEQQAAAEEPKSGNWFSRMLNRMEGGESEGAEAKAAAEETPALSSVPPVPSDFQAVKSEKQGAMEELQSEHMQAEYNKRDLYSEPSSQTAATPELMPLAPPKEESFFTSQPVLLGHASEPADTQEPLRTAIPERAAAPADPVAEVAASEPAESRERQNYWWEGWSLFGGEAETAEADESQPSAEEPVAEELPEPRDMTPMVDINPPPLTTPEPVVPPSQVGPVPTADASEGEPASTEMNASSLPSPAILHSIKTLPPSRYLSRQRALNSSAE